MAFTITSPYVSQNFQNSVYYGVSSPSPYRQSSQKQGIKGPSQTNDDFSVNKNNNAPDDIKTEDGNNSKKEKKAAAHEASNSNGLTEKEQRIVASLKATDTKVRRHEMAHIAAGGQYITSGAHYQYKKGPDGKSYAVAGDVSIDTSPVPGDPEATIAKMHKVQRAALAPADPSPQDKKVAAESSFLAAKALSELMIMQAKQRSDSREAQFQALTPPKTANDAYKRVSQGAEKTGNALDIAA